MRRATFDVGTLTLPWASGADRVPKRPSADGSVLILTLVLTGIGLVMVFSASAVVAGNRFHDPGFFLKRQMVWLAAGLALLHVASRMDYMVWRRLAVPMLGLTALLLVLVLLPGIGVMAKGARRWLRLGSISVQPAEMVKLVAVVYLASYLSRKENRLEEFAPGVLPPLVVVGVLALLVLVQPDLGTVVVMGTLAMGLLFLAGTPLRYVGGVLFSALPLVLMLILRSPYRRQRLMTFLEPWKDPTGSGFQVAQSFLAFGSGGPFGVGLGESKQKLFFLPEAHTDFVLALIGEELGLLGTVSVMGLFVLLVLKGFQIAGRARDPFGRYLALGITLLFGVQALINAGVVTGLLPTKGLTLPLVSYGGSSLLVSLLAIGMLLSISRDRRAGRVGYGEGIARR